LALRIDGLRKKDPLLLEIEIAAALDKALGQLEVPTWVDMAALAAADRLTPPLRKRLEAFGRRMSNEIADLPDGAVWDAFAADLARIPPGQVPDVIRDAIVREVSRGDRSAKTRASAHELALGWQDVPVDPVILAPRPTVRVQRAEDLPAPPPAARPAQRPTTGRSPTPRTPPPPRPQRVDDIERHRWIREQVLGRLVERGGEGLQEAVLLAGIKHRARAEYPDLAPQEVLRALKELEREGRVAHSANRWRSTAPRW
jgi:hypothetical protein